jgi:tRNA (guanine-N7-)-methyltransferase
VPADVLITSRVESNEHHDLRSYGRRRGRKFSDRQAALLRDLLPQVAVDLSAPCGLPAKAGIDVGESRPLGRPLAGLGAKQIFLEIGFGGGEHLLWQAAQHPHVTLIGCEPFEDGVVKVLTRLEDGKLTNIRIHMGDARDVLRALPDASIARAFILFPDPWPKRKHQKRRLVNPQTLSLLARVLKLGAELRIGTDIGDYARTLLLAVLAEPQLRWQASSPDDWRVRPADWPETRYEAKAAREGRRRYYFRFLRV